MNQNDLYSRPTKEGIKRRKFIQGALATGGLAAAGGLTLLRGGNAAEATPLAQDERILVLVHLDGGNDGLNTVIPLNDSGYAAARGQVAIASTGTHSVGNDLWLHPNMGGIKGLFDQGKVAMVHGVGEASNDHSHFTSIARWMAGTSASSPWFHGWMGRYLDGAGLNGLSGMVVDKRGIPLHMARANGEITMLPPNGNLFGSDMLEDGQPSHSSHVYNALTSLGDQNLGKGTWAQTLAKSTATAIAAAQEVSPVFNPEIPMQTEDLVRDMTLAARVINLDVGARVLGVRLGGFDTHSGQRPAHDYLLKQVNDGVMALYNGLNANLRDRVVIMTFSEFGRRVAANGSSATDHGTSASHFIIGDGVAGGHYGQYPSCTDLDARGDLKTYVDFRSIYASVLDGWLRADSTEVLGGTYENLHLFAADKCEGYTPTIIGEPGNDVLYGTNGQDVILGLGGNDIIYGRGGNDVICGGDGHDTIFGGSGNDRIRGEGGNDDIKGESGSDNLGGGAGNDKVAGGRGSDQIAGDSGSDQLSGQRREDTFISDALDIITRGQ